MTILNTYYIRVLPDNYPILLALGERMGAIRVSEDGEVSATTGAWDYIGEIYINGPDTDEEGNSIQVPIANDEGIAYIHANIATELDLLAIGQQMAQEDAEIAVALSDLSNWFVINEATRLATRPKNPHRIFAGENNDC